MQTGNFAVTKQELKLLEDVNEAILQAKETEEVEVM